VAQDGSFTVAGLSPGSYTVFVNPRRSGLSGAWVGGASQSTATAFTVGTASQSIGTVEGTADEVVTVALTRPDGSAIANGFADLVNSEGRSVGGAQTNAYGHATLSMPGATDEHYSVKGGSPSTTTVSQPIQPGQAYVALKLVPAARASITIRDLSGRPVGNVVAGLFSGDALVAAGLTGSDGAFPFPGVPSGDYSIRLYEIFGRFDLPSVAIPVTVEPGQLRRCGGDVHGYRPDGADVHVGRAAGYRPRRLCLQLCAHRRRPAVPDVLCWRRRAP